MNIKIQNHYLTFDGSINDAKEFVDEIRDKYYGGGNDMSKVLHDFVFQIEVALQNEGILDEDFNEIIK
jgi:hypothetical protein